MSSVRIRYRTIEFENVDIHVRTLRDHLQFSDDDGAAERLGISSASWPLFGLIWPSGEVLAHLMLDYEIEGKRILEVGCGIALASLVLNHRNADITATDHHPEVGGFLRKNVQLNDGGTIPFTRTDWSDEPTDLGLFDLIIGSDVLYEVSHVLLLADFIEQHARPTCDIVLVDPGRGNHARFSKLMVSRGFSHAQNRPSNVDYLQAPFKGRVLRYSR